MTEATAETPAGFTVQVPSSFPCPPDDIFSLPTKEELVKFINSIAQIPSKLRVEMVKLGKELKAEIKEEIEQVIKDIEDFIETISELLSPYWKKGTVRNWQKEANDAITEFIQEFHNFIPTKIAELISKIVPISLTVNIFGLSIDCTRLFDPAYQKELQDQISGLGPEYMKKLEKLRQDLKDGKITAEEFRKEMEKLVAEKSAIVDKFFKMLPENMQGWNEEFGAKCDEWKAKYTWQYIKTEIQEFLTQGLHKAFGKLISIFDPIWKLLGLPNLGALIGGDIDVGALIDAKIKSFKEKRDKLIEDLKNAKGKAKEKILEELEGVSKSITDAIGEIKLFGFDILKIIGGKIETTVESLEEKVLEMKLAFKDFLQNWKKKLMFDWVKIVKKFFSAIGLGFIFEWVFFTFCDFLKLIGFPPKLPVIPAIAGVMGVKELVSKGSDYVQDIGDDSGVSFEVADGDKKSFSVNTGTGSLNVFVNGVKQTSGISIVGGSVTFATAPAAGQDVSLILI